MRIGVVTTSYPRRDGEHAGSFVAEHIATLRAQGHDVEVIGAHTIESELFYGAGAPDELERGGLRAWRAAAGFAARLTSAVVRRAGAWDLAIAHWLAPSALAALPARVPLLAIAHGGDIHTLRRLRLLAPALHLLRARGARLAFVSEELRAIARAAAPALANYLERALVQPMGVDVTRFANLGRTPAAEPTLLVIARLVRVKGVDVALAAHRRLRTPARLVIAGDGPERPLLAAGARSDDPARPVTLLGAIDTRERDRLLREASVVVVPSRVLPNGRSEGTPRVALEALAAGVPVVASAVGGLRELPGITRVRPDDPQALAAALDRVLAAPPPPVDVSHLDWPRVASRLLGHAGV